MNRFIRSISIGILALAARTSLSQVISASAIDYGSGNVVSQSSGNGVPTSSCIGLRKYTQLDATAGQNIWECIAGTMVHQTGAPGATGQTGPAGQDGATGQTGATGATGASGSGSSSTSSELSAASGTSTWYYGASTTNVNNATATQGFETYHVPIASSGFQVVFGNASQVDEAVCGPSSTIVATFEYPIDTTPVPIFFNGNLTGTLDPCGLRTSDTIQVDTTASSPLVRVHWLVTKANGDTSQFVSGWGFNSIKKTDLGTLYTGSNPIDAFELDAPRSFGDAVVTSGSTTVTSATAVFNTYDAGNAISIVGAGAGGATLNTTILTAPNATTITLATAAGTSINPTTASISVANKTKIWVLNNNGAVLRAYGPLGLLARQSGTPKSVTLLGDSRTRGVGANPLLGSWAMQALNQAGVAAGQSTGILAAIPYFNMGQDSETAQNLASPTGHMIRFSQISKSKFVLGEIGINDVRGGTSLANLEAYFTTIMTDVRQRGASPFYGTVMPSSTTTDNWLTLANQTTIAQNSVRVAFNNWLRDGAPITCSTGLAAATGATGAVARATYYSTTGSVVNAASGSCTNPAGGIFEFADGVESSRDSGLWKVDPGVRVVTGCSATASTLILTCPAGTFSSADVQKPIAIAGAGPSGALLGSTINVFTSATQVTVANTIQTTVSGANVTIDAAPVTSTSAGRYTADGLHPSFRGHHDQGVIAGNIVATWSF
jgi:lysophospholipase L1-like esterase